MDYKFSNLLGAPYRGGDLLLHGTTLLSPTGNRVSQVNLTHATATCLPCTASTTVRALALSPSGGHLLMFDEDGRALLVNFRRRVVLHHLRFKAPVVQCRFSPSGNFFACVTGKLVQVWRTPGLVKEFAPFQLHRTYGGCHDSTTCVDWSADSRWLVAGSKDLTVRVWSREPVEGYRPPTLAGHRESVVAVFFAEGGPHADDPQCTASRAPSTVYTLSRDGALFHWQQLEASLDNEAVEKVKGGKEGGVVGMARHSGQWRIVHKHFFMQQGKLTCADYHKGTGMLVAGFSTGIFTLYKMPGFEMVHTLSVSRERLSSVKFSENGDWLALGCATLGQLLVWEWRSETYILKQQGHYFDIAHAAYSPDGAFIATGADDNKLKVWNVSGGSCFVTFKEHTAPVSAVQFLPSGTAVLSASLDGTVRAFDLVRYRNFRTFTSPDPVQYVSLAVDNSGEIVCAGTMDTFEIMVWSLRTGRLLDVLSGHEGPVYGLSFSPTAALLASSSWDRTVRTWDVFEAKGAVEPFQHTHDVLTVAYRPDGKQICSSTLDGQLFFWEPHDGICQGSIEGRRDIAPGRRENDRMSAANNSSGRCFTSICYSADGAYLLAGGNSKFVCLYDVEERVLLRRYLIANSRALDGVLDQLSSKNMTDAGPVDLLDTAPSDDEDESLGAGSFSAYAKIKDGLPGATAKGKPAARTKCVRLSPTGRTWMAATTEGLLVYSLDEETMFDPTDLGEDVTPAAAASALQQGAHARALLLALRLKDLELVRRTLEAVPPAEIRTNAQTVPHVYLPRVLAVLVEALEASPHMEHMARWLQVMGVVHSASIQQRRAELMPILRRLNKALAVMHEELSECAEQNVYTLRYLAAAPADDDAAGAAVLGDGERLRAGESGGEEEEEADGDDCDWGGAWVGGSDREWESGDDGGDGVHTAAMIDEEDYVEEDEEDKDSEEEEDEASPEPSAVRSPLSTKKPKSLSKSASKMNAPEPSPEPTPASTKRPKSISKHKLGSKARAVSPELSLELTPNRHKSTSIPAKAGSKSERKPTRSVRADSDAPKKKKLRKSF